jgi:hypothetical protein
MTCLELDESNPDNFLFYIQPVGLINQAPTTSHFLFSSHILFVSYTLFDMDLMNQTPTKTAGLIN